ncbi:Protein CBG22852 [Caenorhabditis briggsae]|uniref:Protein CBG22852 n=1 Tax=Caenorhabditis briggsae TaxID=6238 RepID=A8Y376_CAEBR|nr:Protein CBG22852 [Caenorhabditis briggsae]CAP39345.2 Protein CBG22852 [Caenorhabditis briggsae]
MESVKTAMINYHFLTFLFDLVFSVIVTPYFLAPSFIVSGVGLFEQLGVDPIVQTCFLTITVESMFLSALQIFENRYMVICDAHWIWGKVRVPWLIWNYAMVPFFSLPFYLAAPENPKLLKSEVSKKFPCLPSEILDLQFYIINEDLYTALYTILAFLVFLNVQLYFFLIKLKQKLKNRGTMSEKTRRMQKTFLRSMHIQMVIPIPFIVLPLLFFFAEFFFDFYSQKWNNISVAVCSTFGLFSTLIMLFIHSPYRSFILSNIREFLNFFGVTFGRKPATVIVVPSVTSRNLDS